MAPRRARRFRPVLHPRAGVKLPPELRAGSVGRIAGALPLGVEDPGFELLLRRKVLHAKSLVADGYASVVGSTNLDFRSFVFNAECNLVVLDHATGARMEEIFREDLESSLEILPSDWRKRRVRHRLGDRLARCLSPLL